MLETISTSVTKLKPNPRNARSCAGESKRADVNRLHLSSSGCTHKYG
jgi:hypothetical protein